MGSPDGYPEADAPGIEACRADLEGIPAGREPSVRPHDELFVRLAEVARDYEVLVLETICTLPYTSVFCELDCGYRTASPT